MVNVVPIAGRDEEKSCGPGDWAKAGLQIGKAKPSSRSEKMPFRVLERAPIHKRLQQPAQFEIALERSEKLVLALFRFCGGIKESKSPQVSTCPSLRTSRARNAKSLDLSRLFDQVFKRSGSKFVAEAHGDDGIKPKR